MTHDSAHRDFFKCWPLTFSASFFPSLQVDCLWRSSLRVPRAIRPSLDCCSPTREHLVSSEDQHLLRLRRKPPQQTHTSFQLVDVTPLPHLHPPSPSCLHSWIIIFTFGQCGSFSVDLLLSGEPASCPCAIAYIFIQTGLWTVCFQVLWLLLLLHKKETINSTNLAAAEGKVEHAGI